ncbi:hybrid sensor histidine kinase/response regulator transcription factor [Fulvivirga sediminis]|uniref:histidine kinase n=1 Tax=Fulvivirga sediminis TaxID=2803949 RepID=A0A937K1C8_9BACT|nr:hybrid sensor histidine kinase/response regulator transcription factor [Fulvivirga sediminis]MBL3657205.1 response regulator [Fulvivirga sediminis]
MQNNYLLKGKCCLLILLFLQSFAIRCIGQKARLFSSDRELSSSLIEDILQDHKGIIWIANDNGITKYDGAKFTHYNEQDGILNTYVRTAYEDSKKNLYFGFFNGLQIYNRSTDSFTEIPLILAHEEVFAAHVLCMLERKDGSLLVGTSGHGLFKIYNEKGRLVARQQLDLIPSFFTSSLHEDKRGNLWVTTQDKGIFCLRRNGKINQYFNPKENIGINVNSICEDDLGNIYVGSLSQGLLKYNKDQNRFDIIKHKAVSPPPVKALMFHQDQILIGTDGQGMKAYDPANDEISDLNFQVFNFDFSKAKIHTIIVDRDNSIWLGLFQKGVAVIPSNGNNFQYIGYQSVNKNIIGSNYIMSLYKDSQDVLWVGTDSDGLYAIKQFGEQVKHYQGNGKVNSTPNTILTMFEDSQNTLWLGSFLTGLYRFDRNSQSFSHVSHILDENKSPIQRVFDIAEDNNKNVWIGTLGFGLYSMNLETGKVMNYGKPDNPWHPNDATNFLHNSWITCLLYSSTDDLYIGTTDGVSRLDLESKTFYSLNDLYPELARQNIQCLFQINTDELWIGTSQGLFHIGLEENYIKNYTQKEGLSGNIVCAIEKDNYNNLWISTNHGITELNRQDTTFVKYNYNDGLQGNEFSPRCSFKDSNGTLIFGGINGITYFEPNKIKYASKEIAVTITDFYIHDTPIKKGMMSGGYNIVDTSIMQAEHLDIAVKDNSFTIEFSAMEFINPERISYQYSLNNGEWISLQQGINNVTFNDLDPGTYQFRVKAKDFNIYSPEKKISITIHPLWYFSLWAKVIYVLVAVGIISLLTYYIRQWYRNRKEIQDHLYVEKINKAKLEFVSDIAHEIKTPISLIINPLKKLIATDSETSRQKTYSVIRRNTEIISYLINQLMDLWKIDQGKISLLFQKTDISNFIRSTSEIFEEQIHAKHISFQVKSNHDLPSLWIDQRFFDKIMHNLLSNAIKFTPDNGEITIFLSLEKNDDKEYLKIICYDTGIGLAESETVKIFDRFYQGTNNHLSTGTGIGLHLTKKIVELHHGSIIAENNANHIGCRFTITLPTGNGHLLPQQIIEDNRREEKVTTQPENPAPPLPPDLNPEGKVKPKTKKRVLVVDDNDEFRRYVCDELASEYHIKNCSNGKEALNITLTEKPDLIISDVVMDEMDGITFCKKVKQNINTNHIPVILLTAKSHVKDNLEGLGIGADVYISKPFNMEILKKTAESILKNRELLKNNFSGMQLQGDKLENVVLHSPDEKLMQKVMNAINNNLDNPNLNVEMIAAEVGISRVHLYRKIKEITNQSVREFVRNVRLKQASELLNTKNINVSEVAYATGFSSPSKFSTSFKDLYGVSPSAYIQTRKNEE